MTAWFHKESDDAAALEFDEDDAVAADDDDFVAAAQSDGLSDWSFYCLYP